MIDLDKIEALARAATHGPWEVQVDDRPHHRGGVHIERRIRTSWEHGQLGAPYPVITTSVGVGAAAGGPAHYMVSLGEHDAAHIAAANPAAVLELIALARQAYGAETVAIPLVSGEELLARTQPLPKWIDDMKGSGPTTDSLIEYIEQLRGAPQAQQPAPGAAVVVKDFDIEDAQVLFSAAENMRSADKTGPVIDARFRIAYKVEQIAKRMFAQPPAGAQPVQQTAPPVQRWQDRYNHGVGSPAKIECMRLEIEDWRALFAATAPAASVQPFQQRVQPWMMACFGAEISADTKERNHRFFEESTELVQACGMTPSEAHQLVDYVYGRPVGEPAQEVGGVMVTLAALCLANGLNMHQAAEVELARIWTKVESIRAKQAAKPKHSPLPMAVQTDSERGAALVEYLIRYKHCMSYNDSYFSEPAGELKRMVYAADRAHPAIVAQVGKLSDEQIKEIIFDCHAEDGMGQELDLMKLCRAILDAAKKGGA